MNFIKKLFGMQAQSTEETTDVDPFVPITADGDTDHVRGRTASRRRKGGPKPSFAKARARQRRTIRAATPVSKREKRRRAV